MNRRGGLVAYLFWVGVGFAIGFYTATRLVC